MDQIWYFHILYVCIQLQIYFFILPYSLWNRHPLFIFSLYLCNLWVHRALLMTEFSKAFSIFLMKQEGGRWDVIWRHFKSSLGILLVTMHNCIILYSHYAVSSQALCFHNHNYRHNCTCISAYRLQVYLIICLKSASYLKNKKTPKQTKPPPVDESRVCTVLNISLKQIIWNNLNKDVSNTSIFLNWEEVHLVQGALLSSLSNLPTIPSCSLSGQVALQNEMDPKAKGPQRFFENRASHLPFTVTPHFTMSVIHCQAFWVLALP